MGKLSPNGVHRIPSEKKDESESGGRKAKKNSLRLPRFWKNSINVGWQKIV